MAKQTLVTDRQFAIVRGLAAGLTYLQIASLMDRSRETIRRDVYRLHHEWGSLTACQLVDRAWRLGVLNTAHPLLALEQPLPGG